MKILLFWMHESSPMITGERMGSSIVLNVKFWIVYSVAAFLETLPPNGPFPSNSVFSAKSNLQSSHYKN